MNIFLRMIKSYDREVKEYYKSINMYPTGYESDVDNVFINVLINTFKDDEGLSLDDRLFLIRVIFSKKCKDKDVLEKITLMQMSKDKEMHDLSEQIMSGYYKKK